MANPLYRNDKPGAYPDSWYVASTEMPAPRPTLEGEHKADVCVIGAGFTGLSAALHLAEKGLSVVVLDAHRVGFGASGRNGGQVCSGFDMGPLQLAKRVGADDARTLWDFAEEAKADLRARVAAHVPEARYTPGLIHACNNAGDLNADREEADFLRDRYGYDQLEVCDEDALHAYINSPLYKGGVVDRGAGHLHPLRYVLALARLAEAAGAQIFELSEVTQIAHGTPATLQTNHGRVTADHVVVAGNGYLPGLEPRIASRVMPLNSFIAATEPLGDRAQDIIPSNMAVHDSLFVMHYFRLSEDGRLLLGGRPSYALGFPKDMTTDLLPIESANLS
ncbi:MAG: FAD-binding oxidoreductase [Pseudomonadota bacterium]